MTIEQLFSIHRAGADEWFITEQEILKQKARLLLEIISEMSEEDKNLENFPCWVHMLVPKGTGNSMEVNIGGVHSVVQTMQKHTKHEMSELAQKIAAEMKRSLAVEAEARKQTNHEVSERQEALEKKLDKIATDGARTQEMLQTLLDAMATKR